MTDTDIREARIRPQFAFAYPSMRPDTWYLAATVASALRRDGDPRTGRLLEEHFEFRGGSKDDRGPGARTRSSDPAAAERD